MEIVPIDLFGLHMDTAFPAPLPYASASLDTFSSRLCDQRTGLSIRPDQIRLRRFDELFDYELKAQFFGENGILTRSAERCKLGIRNGRTQGDWNIMQQTFSRFYTLLNPDPASLTHLSAHAHARFETLEARDQWLGQFSHHALVEKTGALGYVRIHAWEKDIRVLIEPSNVVPNAVFCAWDTQFNSGQDWDALLSSITSMMDNTANFFDLGFEPLRDRV